MAKSKKLCLNGNFTGTISQEQIEQFKKQKAEEVLRALSGNPTNESVIGESSNITLDTSYEQFHQIVSAEGGYEQINKTFEDTLRKVRAKDGYTNQTYNIKQNKGDRK